MTTIATGIFSNNIQWTYFVSGLGLGAALVLVDALLKRRGGKMRLPVLAVGLAIYLPPAVNMPLVIGSIIAWFAQRTLKARAAARGENLPDLEKRSERRGVLISSGLIVGESLIGVIVAIIILASVLRGGSDSPLALGIEFLKPWADVLGLVVFVLTSIWFYFKLTKVRNKS
jgi:putative OPT family oligopeptide transporter